MDLHDYKKEDLENIENFLQSARDNKLTGVLQVIKEIREELQKRVTFKEAELELQKKYLGAYVSFDYETGLGISSVFKVDKVSYDEFEGVLLLSTNAEVCLLESGYSIEHDSTIPIYPEQIKNSLKKIDKAEYDAEFDKAIEYYKSLK
jgi:hypothetical protein